MKRWQSLAALAAIPNPSCTSYCKYMPDSYRAACMVQRAHHVCQILDSARLITMVLEEMHCESRTRPLH
eukprot:410854-Amphidinium_carterae.1